MDNEKPAAIRLSGDKILEEHCYFDNIDGKVTLECMPESITVCLLATIPRSLEHLMIILLVSKWEANRGRAGGDLNYLGPCEV